jgi:4-hydroxybenzoate polyprenyltransferase
MIVRFNLNVSFLSYWVGSYALFAFLLTLSREIIKDIEDFEGDFTYGRNTLPVVLGIKISKIVTASILTFTLVTISYLFGAHLNLLPSGNFDYLTFLYFIIGLVVPLFILLVLVLTAEKKEDYSRASFLNKLIMLIGLLYTVVFRFLIA